MTASAVKATVAILTYNGEEYLEELLRAVMLQADVQHEVLVIDSGSSDRTLEIVRRFPDVRLHEIPNAEFGHGRTRNLAAELARGDFIAFLTQDATPAHDRWLAELLRPFEVIGPRLACVFGKQVPRRDCCPTVKRDVANLFASFGPDHFIAIQSAGPMLQGQAVNDALGFFSDVNSAVRRSVLLDEIPYEDVQYAEDQVFGRAVIRAGLLKAYAPLGAVVHSHSYPPMTYFRRMFDEFTGLRAATGSAIPITRRELWLGWIRPTIGDWRHVLRDRDYGRRAKLKWLVQAPAYNVLRRVAMRLAAQRELSDRARRRWSLEARARRSSDA